MFSKELENLINASLEDGVLEEYEKAAIVKRAQAEGVDLTELEIYINSILQRRKRELNEKKEEEYKELERQKQNEIGKVCPKCGKEVPPLTLVCNCGFEFKKNEVNSSVKKLAKKIQRVSSSKSEVINAIQSYQVPNTKEDIVEFCAMAISNSKVKGGLWGTVKGRIKILGIIAVILFIGSLIFGGDAAVGLCLIWFEFLFVGPVFAFVDQDIIESNDKANAWRAKLEEVIIKGRSMRGDTEFTRLLDYYESLLEY